MTRKIGLMGIALVAGVAGLVGAGSAAEPAFCVVNRTSVPVHAQALDATGFAADIAPGGTACCDGAACGGLRDSARLLVVTDYRPVTRTTRAGWTAECRAAVPAGGRLVVTGTRTAIACAVER